VTRLQPVCSPFGLSAVLDPVDDLADVGDLFDRVFDLFAPADFGRGGVVGTDVLGPGVLVEGVPDREVPVGDDGATDQTLDAVVLGGLVDDEVLDAVEGAAVALDRTFPACHTPAVSAAV